MKCITRTVTAGAALAIVLVAAPASRADDQRTRSMDSSARGSMGAMTADSKRDIIATAREGASVFQKFTTGTNQIPAEQLARAKCVAVFPGVTQVALGVGGSHGDGIVSCKTSSGWSAIAPLDMTGASIGAQLGAKKTDMVLLITTDKARRQLENGTMTLGANASFVASKEDRKAMETEITSKNPDVLAYAEDRGLFAGAALDGTGVRIDPDEVSNFYSRSLTPAELLGSGPKEDAPNGVREFLQALPRI